jgi:hypothetical protein
MWVNFANSLRSAWLNFTFAARPLNQHARSWMSGKIVDEIALLVFSQQLLRPPDEFREFDDGNHSSKCNPMDYICLEFKPWGSATRLRQSPLTGDIVAFCSRGDQGLATDFAMQAQQLAFSSPFFGSGMSGRLRTRPLPPPAPSCQPAAPPSPNMSQSKK